MMRRYLIVRIFTSALAFAAVIGFWLTLGSKSLRADNDNNGAQDEMQMIQIGLNIASQLNLNVGNKDSDMVGLGSYLVNVVADCNGCHSAGPTTEFAPGGNPYLLPGKMPPLFSGTKKINATTYLGGGRDFGTFGPGPTDIISRNLTPDKSGLPEGGRTLSQFITIMRTGADLDVAHPSCAMGQTSGCLSFPFNGALLQVMPWPSLQNMTDRQLTAIYTYLSTVPCLEGGPGEPAHRCGP
jgi:hypothetical protein